MKIIFMGTPEFAVPSLEALLESGHEIAGVVTQPDRPKGRGHKLTPPPVKTAGQEAGLEVYQPDNIKTPQFLSVLKNIAPDLIVVVAFGQILSKEILNIPKYGCINVHASLLPKYRGAAPIHWAVINGESETGITIMQMDEGLDSGDIIISEKISIEPEDTTGTIHDKLKHLGARLLLRAVELINTGKANRVPQDHDSASYAPLLTKEIEEIDWSKSSIDIFNLVRGLNPWPGARTFFGDKILKVWETKPCTTDRLPGPIMELADEKPGVVLGRVPGVGLAVATGNGCLAISEVQIQGGRKMNAEQFMNGYKIEKGTRLGREQSV